MTDDKQPISIKARERRLDDIRAEADRHRQVRGIGVRPAGAPFPVASPETGYYGIPLLKEPQWTWEVPLYFFAGGATGASAIIGAAARWTGKDLLIARDCRYIAAGGAILSSALLIADLGRPNRFLNMLRVFKPQSAMSVGAWVLASFGTFAGASAFAEWLRTITDIRAIEVIGNVAEGFACAFGLPLATYTGVLLGATAVPVWNEHVTTLPIHFGMSGLNTAVGLLELLGHDGSPALQALGLLAATVESAEGIRLETNFDRVAEPVKHGASGWIIRTGGMLSGPIPLGLRLASLFVAPEKRRKMRRMAAASSIAGSLITRYAWMHAGRVSARDWRLPLEIEAPSQQSQLPDATVLAPEPVRKEVSAD